MSHSELTPRHEVPSPGSGLDLDVDRDPRETLLGRLIRGQTIAVGLLAAMIAAAGLLLPGSGLLRLLPLAVIAAVVGLAAYALLRRRRVRLASLVFLIGTSLAITVNIYIRGYADASALYYLWPILSAALLLEARNSVAIVALCAILYALMVVLQRLGYLTPPLPYDPQSEVLLTVGSRLLMFVLLAFLGSLSSQNLRRALDRARQAAQAWRGLNETLEQRVADRTADLERRARQLTTAADVGRAAASILELRSLTQQVVELVRDRFDLYYTGLFLLDASGQYAVLEAGTGEAGRLMKDQGHKLEVGGRSMVGTACAQRQAHIAVDVGEEPVRFANPLLPDTRTEMALPLMVGDRVLGALDVQSTRPSAFSSEDITVLQLVADQVAVSVDNAHKFSEEAGLLEATSPFYRVGRRLTAALTTDEIVQTIIASVAETEADGCAIAQFGYGGVGAAKTTGTVGLDETVESLTFLGAWDRTGASRFLIGVPLPAAAFMMPVSVMSKFLVIPEVAQEAQFSESTRQALLQVGAQAVVNIPLWAGRRCSGCVVVQRSTTGPFSPGAIRLYETLVDQAAMALERARLLDETQRQAWREHTVRNLSDRVTLSLDIDTVLETALDGLGHLVGASAAYVELGTGTDSSEPR